MSVKMLNKEIFNNEVISSEKTVLIDFYADWCGPCRMMSPIVDEIADETTSINVYKVNVDKEPELSQIFEVSSIPTIIVMKNGKVTAKSIGAKPKSDILSMLTD